MDVLRTPEERFQDLPGFDYEPRYAEVADGSVRMTYVQAGPAEGTGGGLPARGAEREFLVPACHGCPERGRGTLRRARYAAWVRELLFDALDLRELTLLGQDWGGLIGLRLVAENPDRFARVVAANTGLPTGDEPMPEAWWAFRNAVDGATGLDIARFIQAGCRTRLDTEVLAAYDAPFPDERYKAGPRALPTLVPTDPRDPATEANRAAWARLTRWDKPFLVAFSDSDPITGPMAPILRRSMPGAAGLDHPVIENAGHFLQEDAGTRLGGLVADFVIGGR